MIVRRTNGQSPAASAEARFAAVDRHHTRMYPQDPRPGPDAEAAEPPPPAPTGDIIYGARAIALFLFGDGNNRFRRRVFNLWAHYNARNERAGFFKLKGALCLSKAQWRSFHGLG